MRLKLPSKSFARGAAAEFALKVGLASHPPLGFAVGAPLTFRSVTDSSLGSQAIHIAVALLAELVEVAELAVVLEGCSTHCSGHQTLFENQVHEPIEASYHSEIKKKNQVKTKIFTCKCRDEKYLLLLLLLK